MCEIFYIKFYSIVPCSAIEVIIEKAARTCTDSGKSIQVFKMVRSWSLIRWWKWWFLISGIIIVALLCIFFYFINDSS